jgi:hypothetical protein
MYNYSKGETMSLGIVIKGPEGLVLAADSRVTLGTKFPNGDVFHVNFDNATKLLSFSKPNSNTNIFVGAVTYGQAIVGTTNRTVNSFLPEYEADFPSTGKRLSVSGFAEQLSNFFLKQWNNAAPINYPGPNIIFVVAGYNENEYFGRVYLFEIPGNPNPEEKHPSSNEFGITWGGQREFVDRIIQGYDERLIEIISKTFNLDKNKISDLRKDLAQLSMQLPLQMLPLQDCVDLAIFFLRTTIDAQRLTVGIRAVGGPIEIATITRREGFQFLQRKKIVGEGGRYYELTNSIS